MNYKCSLVDEDGSLIIGHCDNITGLLETNISETADEDYYDLSFINFHFNVTLNRFAQTESIP